LNNLFIFFKLREARSFLYRRRFLQPNTRWKALDEIYKMYILLHRSDLKISGKNRPTFLRKWKWISFYSFRFCDFSSEFGHFSVKSWWNFPGVSRKYQKILQILSILL